MAKYQSGDASGGTLVKTQHFDAPDDAPDYLKDALHDMGTIEWVKNGAARKSNPIVEKWIEEVSGKRQNAINTPWCAFYVGAKLEEHGIASTKDGMARSYLSWGQKVASNDWQVGDICVLMRGEYDDHVLGHVGFLIAWDDDSVTLYAGNQSDMVCIHQFPRSRVLGVRRPRGITQSHTMRSIGGASVDEAVVKPAVDSIIPSADKVADVAEQARGPLEILAQYKPWIMGVLTAITVGLLLYAAYCRYTDHQSGKNT